MTLFQFVLFLHILVAIVGFGPSFAYPFIGREGAKDPAHARFALHVVEVIATRLAYPLIVIMPFLGLWLIYLRDWDLWQSEWLVISIAIYVTAFTFSVLVQTPTAMKLLKKMEGMEAGASGPPGGQAPAAGQGGPPPEIARLVKRVQLGGAFLGLMVVSITLLMVWKPGGTFTG